ncbi:hypothetical protein [Nocardioides sp. TF02-7]|uniref:hypothetical protein n=1 Tax=Nocardioides sp. TF02-7 TaxID=2917724 RepID=UPI001F05DA2F|nr:hypothetical protein [Nocardioides sp. TF02-7]UMG93175.1 hypothetical protein MF408_02390 [Nocardioides sp. TF02-7]
MGAALGEGRSVALGAAQHDVVAAALPRLDDRVDQVGPLLAGVDAGAGRRLEPLLDGRRLRLHLPDDHVDPVLEEPVAGLLEQQPADAADHDRGEQQGEQHDAGLDRATPEGERPAHLGGQCDPGPRGHPDH